MAEAATTSLNSAPSTSFALTEYPFVYDSLSVTLQDRALPYRPISINGRQRAEFTWYPGSPNATVQMLGPEEGVISLRGFWKDRFLAGSDNVIALRGGGNPLSRTDTVADLVRLVDEMRRRGKQICLTWDDLIRYGHITSFTQTWHNHHDCEWEMEFSVISQEDPTTKVETLAFTAPTAADVWIEATNKTKEANKLNLDSVWGERGTTAPSQPPDVSALVFSTASSIKPKPPDWWAAGWNNLVKGAEDLQGFGGYIELAANEWANGLGNVAQQALYIAQTPSELGRNLLNALAGPAATLFRAGGSLLDGALTEYYTYAEVFQQVQQDNVPFGIQLGQKSYLTRWKAVEQDIRTSNAVWRARYTEELMNTTVRTFVAPADMDLRDVCTKFYGTQDGWIELMIYNGLVVSRIPAGFVVRVPERLDGAPAGRT